MINYKNHAGVLAQGTIEYLVIIAIVIVISLVVVGLSTNIFSGSSNQINLTTNELKNKIGSSSGGIMINEIVADSIGNGVLQLTNVSGDSFTISQISSINDSVTQGVNNFDSVYVPISQEVTFSLSAITSDCQCNIGDSKKTCTFAITLTSSSGLTKTQNISTTVDCVTTAQATSTTIPPSLSTPYIWVPDFLGSSMYKLSTAGSVVSNTSTPGSAYGVAVDGAGNVWITNEYVTKINGSTGAIIGNYDSNGLSPYGIAIDFNGNVWVANYNDIYGGLGNVSKLSSNGSLLGTYFVGTRPFGVAVDLDGNIWVSDDVSREVYKLSPSGTILGTYSTTADGGESIAVDGNNNVWVLSISGGSVKRYNARTGALVGSYTVGSGGMGIATDSNGNIWITDNFDNKLHKVSGSTGALLGSYNTSSSPSGVAVDASDRAWVFHWEDNNVMVFNSSGTMVGNYDIGTKRFGVGDFTGFYYQYFILGRR